MRKQTTHAKPPLPLDWKKIRRIGSTRFGLYPKNTLLSRLKHINHNTAYNMIVQANDEIIKKLERRGTFKKQVLAAADLTDDPYYGKYHNKIRRSKQDRGTNQFYTHASLHLVEHGKRITIFTVPVFQLDNNASILEKLILAARKRGIHISTLLVDRGFFSVEVINKLKDLRVRFLMPAIKHDRVKQVIKAYNGKHTQSMSIVKDSVVCSVLVEGLEPVFCKAIFLSYVVEAYSI